MSNVENMLERMVRIYESDGNLPADIQDWYDSRQGQEAKDRKREQLTEELCILQEKLKYLRSFPRTILFAAEILQLTSEIAILQGRIRGLD